MLINLIESDWAEDSLVSFVSTDVPAGELICQCPFLFVDEDVPSAIKGYCLPFPDGGYALVFGSFMMIEMGEASNVSFEFNPDTMCVEVTTEVPLSAGDRIILPLI